ncbi:MAG: GW dipeptide domain-containing protein [Candidatus Marinimicrobia bacterium]|nr:GW dipeptide domain-containing protein [Candidatus Neomarinimicrobiota bacterium]
MRFSFIVISSVVMVTLVACDSKERVKAPEQSQSTATPHQTASNNHQVKVEEVIQAKSYTYLRVTEGSQEYWIATSKQIIEEGQTLHYGQGLEMKNFTSKELERDFESIWFVGQMDGAGSMARSTSSTSPSGNHPNVRTESISVEKVTDGVSIQELYADMSAFEGKTVSVRGEVTKFNSKIMGRNWVHLQDGTSSGEYFDVTITTMDPVKVGDVVVFKGKVTLKKDFGAGYKYDLIIEEAVLVAES